MTLPLIPTLRRAALPAVAVALLLAACTVASSREMLWPPAWPDDPQMSAIDFTPPSFDAPSATDCQRLPTTREVPGDVYQQQQSRWRGGEHRAEASRGKPVYSSAPRRKDAAVPSPELAEEADKASLLGGREDAPRSSGALAKSAAPAIAYAEPPAADFAPPPPWPSQPQPQVVQPPRPQREIVTAGMVDDNADFGEYLSYRQRRTGMMVRERDISERYLLEVTDAQGNPVHDAEVAVQRPGVAQPVMWARTDTAGHVWLHPRAFLAPSFAEERTLGVAVRKDGVQSRALLTRGQSNSVQVRLNARLASPMRLDLVFLVDATGSMSDEIAKLKSSMRAVADQISQLPGQPDICYGLVAYRDRGDAFLTRTHDFTNNLGAFQQVLANVQAAGGGDNPEAMNEALHEVVHGMSWRKQAARMVVLVADAPPHLDYGGPQYDRDMQAALSKGIKLFAVGASGLDPVGEYIFRQMAQYTAGRFVFLTYRDTNNPGSGPGTQTVHDVKQYSVQTLDKLVVRLVGDELARLKRG